MPANEILKEFWTRDALTRLSEVIASAIADRSMPGNAPQPAPHPPFLEVWREFCIKFNLKPGAPDFYVKNAHYGKEVVADYYDFEELPIYWEWKNTVVFLNPFFDASNFKQTEDFLKYRWLEIDAEMAMKFLVLGIPQ